MLSWILGALAVLLLIAFLGALPGLNWYGTVVRRGPALKSRLALTFDDGPHPETTRQVLALLNRFQVCATFFVIGEKVELYPDVIREIVAGGHELGLHGYRHSWFYAFWRRATLRADLERSLSVLRELGVPPLRWFRPPIGVVSPAIASVATSLGLTLAGWSLRGLDGLASTRRETFRTRVCERLTSGGIVLLHDTSEHDTYVPLGVTELESLLTEATARKLKCVTLSDLLNLPHHNAHS